MSVLGLYNNDDSLFDLMNYPEGMTDDDKDCVKNSILTECAELEVLYPNPTVMKNMIGLWSYKELFYWQRVYNASQLEYNPIENYRRNESETIEDDRTEEHSGSDVNRASGSDTSTDSGSDRMARTGTDTVTDSGSDTVEGSSTVEVEQGGNDRVDHNVSGYDSNLLVTSTEDETTYGKTETTTTEATNETTYGKIETRELDTLDTATYGKVNTFAHGKTDTLTHGEKIEHGGTTERTVLAYGNIGVTTSQEMLTQEMEIAKILNVIPVIVESFKERFCLMVY